MGLETGDFITDLVDTNPVGGTDKKHQGDNHLQLIKKVVKNSFPGHDYPWGYKESAGSDPTYTVTLDEAPSAYTEGMMIFMKASFTNAAGAADLNVNALGAKNIYSVLGTELWSNMIISGGVYCLIYDGTQFILLNPSLEVSAHHENVIINGFGLIDQRASETRTGLGNGDDGVYLCDRFSFAERSTPDAEVTFSLETDIPSRTEQEAVWGAGNAIVGGNSMKFDVTTQTVSIGASDAVGMTYAVEGPDYQSLHQGAYVLSFWHKHTKTGTWSIAFENDDNDRVYAANYTQSVTNTWEFASIVVPADTTGTWVMEEGEKGLRITFAFLVGTSEDSPADGSWETVTTIITGSEDQVDGCDNTANNIMFWGFNLHKGSYARPPKMPLFQDELIRCLRYYFRIEEQSSTTYFGNGNYTTTTNFALFFQFPVQMCQIPSPGWRSVNDVTVVSAATETGSNLATSGGSKDSIRFNVTTTTAGDGDGGIAYLESGTGGYIEMDAELI
jgi:hypothetical protein